MFAGLSKVWHDVFTENAAGTVWCPVRIFAGALITSHVGATIWQVVQHGVFDPVAFGTGSAALLGATGAAIGIKTKLGSDAP